MDDKQFTNAFATVLAILVGITVLILIIARTLAGLPAEPDQAMQQAIAERIKPIGEVNIGTVPAVAVAQSAAQTETPQADAQQAAADPAETYNTVCAVCHATGVAAAPIYGDKATWASRLGDVEALYTNSLKGKGAMPPKGGRPDLSDEAIKAAVDYMLEAVR